MPFAELHALSPPSAARYALDSTENLPQSSCGNTTAQGTSNSAILNNNYVSLLSDRLSAHAYKHENGVTNEAIVIEWAAVAAW